MRIASIDEVLRMIADAEMKEMKRLNKVATIGNHDITNCFYSKVDQNDVFVAYVAPFAIEKSISVQCVEKDLNTEICFSWENRTFNDMIDCDTVDYAVTNFQYNINATGKIKVPGTVNKKTAVLTFENGLIIFKCKLNHSQDNSFELRCGKK